MEMRRLENHATSLNRVDGSLTSKNPLKIIGMAAVLSNTQDLAGVGKNKKGATATAIERPAGPMFPRPPQRRVVSRLARRPPTVCHPPSTHARAAATILCVPLTNSEQNINGVLQKRRYQFDKG